MTLLEVIVSLAILGGSVVVIGELARASFQSARTARDLVQAELMAESIMAKIRLGIIEMEQAYDVPIGSYYTVHPADVVYDTHALSDSTSEVPWSYSVYVMDFDDYLIEVTVEVRQNPPENPRAVACRLVRWFALEPVLEEEYEYDEY